MTAFDPSPLPIPPDSQLALEILYNRVVAQFATDKVACEFSFGWKEPPRQGKLPTAHITFTPGDPSGKVAKEHTGARYPGQLPIRNLLGLWELFTIKVHAQDPNSPNDERAQYRACRLLYDKLLRAIYLSAFGNFTIDSDTWVSARKEGLYGRCIEVVGGILVTIPDLPVTLAPTDVKAELTESLGASADPVVEILPES